MPAKTLASAGLLKSSCGYDTLNYIISTDISFDKLRKADSEDKTAHGEDEILESPDILPATQNFFENYVFGGIDGLSEAS